MDNPLQKFLAEKGGKEKHAGFMDLMARTGRAIGGHMAPAIGTVAVGALAGAGYSAYGAAKEHITKARDYKAMLQENPTLRKEDPHKVQMLYNSFRRLSPGMAGDPLLSGSFVRDTLTLSPEEGPSISPMTAKTLADTQKAISQHKKDRGGSFQKWVTNPGVSVRNTPEEDAQHNWDVNQAEQKMRP